MFTKRQYINITRTRHPLKYGIQLSTVINLSNLLFTRKTFPAQNNIRGLVEELMPLCIFRAWRSVCSTATSGALLEKSSENGCKTHTYSSLLLRMSEQSWHNHRWEDFYRCPADQTVANAWKTRIKRMLKKFIYDTWL